MISGFFKRLTSEEYFQEVERKAEAPVEEIIEAIVHPPPTTQSVCSTGKRSPRRCGGAFIRVRDEIQVLEEVDVNTGGQNTTSAVQKEQVEKEEEENAEPQEEGNKLTIRFRKRKKRPLQSQTQSDSDVDLNFLEEGRKPSPTNAFGLLMMKESSKMDMVEEMEKEEEAVAKPKAKRGRPCGPKKKVAMPSVAPEKEEDPIPPQLDESSSGRRVSSRVRIKRVFTSLEELASSEDDEDLKPLPRKKHKKKERRPRVDYNDDDEEWDRNHRSLSTSKKSNVKLASIFVRESPEVSAARKAFLNSKAPEEALKKLRAADMSAEALGHDYFNDFSNVQHVNYEKLSSSTQPHRFLLRPDSPESSNPPCLPSPIKLSWLLLSKEKEETRPRGVEIRLPLSRNNIFDFAARESPSFQSTLIRMLKREVDDAAWIPWTKKFAPTSSDHVLGNHNVLTHLKTWLQSFSTKSKFRDNDADSVSSSLTGDFGSNSAVLFGPHGCGKSASVYALASELGLKVMEVNASSYRSGRLFTSQTHEATQSHRVERSSGVKPLFKSKEALPEKKESLILVEDIDLFFEDGDEGFYQALSGVIGCSKRPIVLTYSSLKPKAIPLSKIEQIVSYQFESQSVDATADYLRSIALREGYPLALESVRTLVESLGGNIAKSLVTLQFLCSSSRATGGTPNSPSPPKHVDNLSEALGISTPIIEVRPNALDLWTPPIPMCNMDQQPKGAIRVERKESPSQRKRYSAKDISEMEKLALDFENHSAFCENEESHLAPCVVDSELIRVESEVLESLYRFPGRNSRGALYSDVLPTIRTMARFEDIKRNANSKRRYIHYFHSQLNIPVSSEDISLLTAQLPT